MDLATCTSRMATTTEDTSNTEKPKDKVPTSSQMAHTTEEISPTTKHRVKMEYTGLRLWNTKVISKITNLKEKVDKQAKIINSKECLKMVIEWRVF